MWPPYCRLTEASGQPLCSSWKGRSREQTGEFVRYCWFGQKSSCPMKSFCSATKNHKGFCWVLSAVSYALLGPRRCLLFSWDLGNLAACLQAGLTNYCWTGFLLHPPLLSLGWYISNAFGENTPCLCASRSHIYCPQNLKNLALE